MARNLQNNILKTALLTAGLFVVMFLFSLPLKLSALSTYEITVYITGTDGGTVTYNGAEKLSGSSIYVDENSLAAFFVEAREGYSVGNVKYSGGTITKSGSLYTTPAVTSNGTLYITFEQKQDCEITFDVGAQGWIVDKNGNSLYSSVKVGGGESFTFGVTTIDGYGVKSVTFDGAEVLSDASGYYTITPDSNGTLSVSFAKFYTVDFIIGAEGVVTDTDGNIISGETIEIVQGMPFKFIVDAEDGYAVSNINYAFGGTIRKLSQNSDGSYTIPSMAEACTVYIDFQQAYDIEIKAAPKGCTLTAKNGTENLTIGKQSVIRGASVKITASTEAGTGYIFEKFVVNTNNDEKVYNEPEINLLIASDTVIEPIYNKVDTYTITIISNGGGRITQVGGYSPNDSNIRVNRGDKVTLNIVPEANYKLDTLTYSGAALTKNNDGSYTTEEITDNRTLEVNFKGKSDNVTGIEVTDNGTVVSVKDISNIEEVIADNDGNIIKAPIGNGILSSDAQYSLLGKRIWLDIYGDRFSWNINSANLSGEDFAEKNLNVSLKDEYATSLLTQLLGYENKQQLKIKQEGSLGFSATLNIDTGEKNRGKYASLFVADTDNYTVKGISSVLIDDEGIASFVIESGGNYIIVIADKEISDSDIVKVNSDGKIDTGKKQLIFAVVLLVILVSVGGLIAYAMSKMGTDK